MEKKNFPLLQVCWVINGQRGSGQSSHQALDRLEPGQAGREGKGVAARQAPACACNANGNVGFETNSCHHGNTLDCSTNILTVASGSAKFLGGVAMFPNWFVGNSSDSTLLCFISLPTGQRYKVPGGDHLYANADQKWSYQG